MGFLRLLPQEKPVKVTSMHNFTRRRNKPLPVSAAQSSRIGSTFGQGSFQMSSKPRKNLMATRSATPSIFTFRARQGPGRVDRLSNPEVETELV